MITVVLQILLAALALTFGVLALLVSRHMQSALEIRRAGWLLTGLIFFFSGVSSFGQNIWAAQAFMSGPGSGVYESYMQWAALGNHFRQFLLLAFACGLFMIFLKKIFPRLRLGVAMISVSVVVVGLGIFVGWAEGALNPEVHFTKLTLSTMALLFLLVGALLGNLLAGTLDRLLWLALLIYTVRQALDIPWLAAFAISAVADTWEPSPRVMPLMGIVAYISMIGLTVYRLILARRGEKVPALFEAAPRKEFSSFA